MSREIKFRFYSNITKKMYTEMNLLGLQYQYDNDPTVYCADKVPKDDGSERVQHYSDGHLMQYTGLKDKNGKEIYEGDILDTGKINGKCGVVFLNGIFGVVDKRGGALIPIGNFGLAKNGEVIGNIYENPDLLNKE